MTWCQLFDHSSVNRLFFEDRVKKLTTTSNFASSKIRRCQKNNMSIFGGWSQFFASRERFTHRRFRKKWHHVKNRTVNSVNVKVSPTDVDSWSWSRSGPATRDSTVYENVFLLRILSRKDRINTLISFGSNISHDFNV